MDINTEDRLKELTVLDLEIIRLASLVKESDEKLEYLSGSPLTIENYHNGNLHLQIRKLTVIANRDHNVFYCSRCGERLNNSKERVDHVMMDHEEKL